MKVIDRTKTVTQHFLENPFKKLQERPLMQSIKGRRLIVYACVMCWTTRNNQGQSPLSL